MVGQVKITRAGMFISTPVPFGLGFGKSSRNQVPKIISFIGVEKDGREYLGAADEFAMVGWFDKGNIESEFLSAMTTAASRAVSTVQKYYNGKAYMRFTAARERGDYFRDMSSELNTTGLALQAIEAIEGRALLDALSRAENENATDFILDNGGFDLHKMSDGVSSVPINEILYRSSEVPRYLPFRYTVGLPDVICEADQIPDGESLEAEIKNYKLRRFKIKIDDDINKNIERLCQMAEVIQKYNKNSYEVTLDGNEAFESWDTLIAFAERFSAEPRLKTMAANTKYLEQPFHRDKLEQIHTEGIDAIAKLRDKYGLSVLIDESGGDFNSFESAIEKGITGAALKLCKGAFHGLYDVAFAYEKSKSGKQHFITAEDLTHADPTGFPQAVHLFSAIKHVGHPELNGAFKTKSGYWLTEDEKKLAARTMPYLYEFRDGELRIKITGNEFPTADVLGIGLGGHEVCFDPMVDVPDLRKVIEYVN